MEGKNNLIELQGIVRNATKLGVKDGQCEDLVNLRFRDGSWRASGNGRLVHSMSGEVYSQIYIHSNSPYHHVLGVRNGKLYWFANLENDAITFVPKDTPEEICSVANGDIYITQTGHLLTIIDSEEDFEYSIFVSGENNYRLLNVDTNGKQDSRKLYPFGDFKINLYNPKDNEHSFSNTNEEAGVIQIDFKANDEDPINWNDSGALLSDPSIWHAMMLESYNKMTEKNLFTRPLIAIVTVNLYDGTTAFASNPIYLFPNEKLSSGKRYYIGESDEETNNNNTHKIGWIGEDNGYKSTGTEIQSFQVGSVVSIPVRADAEVLTTERSKIVLRTNDFSQAVTTNCSDYQTKQLPNFSIGASSIWITGTDLLNDSQLALANTIKRESNYIKTKIYGSELIISLDSISEIVRNSDIFSGISIYVTPQADLYDMSADGWRYNNGQIAVCLHDHVTDARDGAGTKLGHGISRFVNATYVIKRKTDEEIIHQLTHSPFYLLRKYTITELKSMQDNIAVVDLSGPEYNGLLSQITNQTKLEYEAQSRTTYLPKVAYSYNGRLHIANYKSIQFHGFPIDLFHRHNHSVKYQVGASYLELANIANNNDEYSQFHKVKHNLITSTYSSEHTNVAALIRVKLETQDGDQYVSRFIKVSNNYAPYSSFIEDLNPLITFPDSRAKEIHVYLIYSGTTNPLVMGRQFNLVSHPYLNMAYYIDENLNPISLGWTPYEKTPEWIEALINESNNVESFPNGIKVSKTNNPYYFPVENAYQIGNGEILALCSNNVAVGTGQTGDAPLYVFCTDGIHALFVDSTGQLAYPNARILARDVLSSRKSVTPIDNGIVFATQRGLMVISGSQVQEIGQPAEGEVYDFSNTNHKGKKLMYNSFTMSNIASLPSSMLDFTDFLAYINQPNVRYEYNHNLRELMVSNPAKSYSWVLDRSRNWSRRSFSADEYVNNFPTSYRVSNGNFYKIDEEQGGGDTAKNSIFVLSQAIKLGNVAFKQAYRFVVRGHFKTEYNATGNESNLTCIVFGSYDARQWSPIGWNNKSGEFEDIGCEIARTDCKFFRILLAGIISKDSRIDFMEMSADVSPLLHNQRSNKIR